jgi:16S rRNA (uracil1498-N3)-methyltransferase
LLTKTPESSDVRFLTTFLAYHINQPFLFKRLFPLAQLQRLSITPSQCVHEIIILTADQHHYLTRVLRLVSDAEFIAIPNTGVWWVAQLQADCREAKILQTLTPNTELSGTLTLLAAPSKGQGFDDVVRMTTELGVSRIIPLMTERTILQPGPQRVERWQRIAQEAAEQSHRLLVPEVTAPLSMSETLQWIQPALKTCSSCLIGVIEPSTPHLLQLHPFEMQQEAMVFLGPEGGWTKQEQEAAIAMGCQPFSLGQRVLRAVTAAITTISLLSSQLELQQRT